MMKENLDTNRPNVKFTFLNQDESGKTMLNILNPDSGSGKCCVTVCVCVCVCVCVWCGVVWCVCVGGWVTETLRYLPVC